MRVTILSTILEKSCSIDSVNLFDVGEVNKTNQKIIWYSFYVNFGK